MLCKVTITKLLRGYFHFSIGALLKPPLIQSERFQIVSDVYDTGKKYLQNQRRTAIGYCWAVADMHTRSCLSYNLILEANITNRIKLMVMMMMVMMMMMRRIAVQWIPVLPLTRVSTSLCACLWYEHHYSFCVFGVASQMKSVEFKQLSPYQLYT